MAKRASMAMGTLLFLGTALAQGSTPEFVAGEVLVRFAPGASVGKRAALVDALDATTIRSFRTVPVLQLRLRSTSVEEAIARFADDPSVEYIEPNYLVHAFEIPDDPLYPQLWALDNRGQTFGTPGADISATEAWDLVTDASNVLVAVIDTGIDVDHPDLAANIFVNSGEIAGNGVDDDANGYVDDVHGWDFVNHDADPYDDNGHGTHVAGTIGAIGDNGLGVVGVAWKVQLLPLKFLGRGGSGSTADAIECVEYATAMGADISNNSWGGAGFSRSLHDAIAAAHDAGIAFVAAAGNEGWNLDVEDVFPAEFEVPNVVAVAATDADDFLTTYTNYGSTSVDLAAPGFAIVSTSPGNEYLRRSGTSMAAPLVTGTLALMRARSPNMSMMDLIAQLLANVDPVPQLEGRLVTGGRLDAFAALAALDATPPAPISDLELAVSGSNWLELAWTATGDDGSEGRAFAYEFRYATVPFAADDISATQSYAPPQAPSVAGVPERLRLPGLDTLTTYWVAVVARDELGLASVSNVVSATTLGSPSISVSPIQFLQPAATGEMHELLATIRNVGAGWLDAAFRVADPQATWLRPTESEFSVYQGETRDLRVQLDATGLAAGLHLAELLIESNDPALPESRLPIALDVTAAPDLELSPEPLEFGSVLLTQTADLDFQISNVGGDSLIVDELAVVGDAIVLDRSAPLVLAPGEAISVTATWTPTIVGALDAFLRIVSNDAAMPTFEQPLIGEALGAPRISMERPETRVSLDVGELQTRQLRVRNEGLSDLALAMSLKQLQTPPTSNRRPLPPSSPRVLLVHGGYVEWVRSALAQVGFATVDLYNAQFGVPELSKLSSYDVVLLSGVGYLYLDRDASGDRLADYVDAGGTVIECSPVFVGSYGLGGRWALEGYSAFRGATGLRAGAVELGDFDADHPIFDGVQQVTASYFVPCQLAPDVQVVARFANGTPLLATRDMRVVSLNLEIEREDHIGGDVARLVGNALRWLGVDLGWLRVRPRRAIVPAAGFVDLTIEFDGAAALDGDFAARLDLLSDDPQKPSLAHQCAMRAVGQAQLGFFLPELSFGNTWVDATKASYFQVENVGTAPLTVGGVQSNRQEFGVVSEQFSLLPGAIKRVDVSFSPDQLGEVEGRFEFSSNDVDEPLKLLRVTGTGVLGPELETAPTTFELSLPSGDVTTTTLELRNVGGASLHWSAALQYGEIVRTTSSNLDGVRVHLDLSLGQVGSVVSSTMTADLAERGASVLQVYAALTPALLEPADIYWTNDMTVSYSNAQLDALTVFVTGGGALLLSGDELTSLDNFAAVLERLGVPMSFLRVQSGALSSTLIQPHAITREVGSVWFDGATAAIVSAQSPAISLVHDAYGNAMLAVAQVGAGRVAVVTDQLFDGVHLGHANNRRLANQLFDWLAGPRFLSLSSTGGTILAGSSRTLSIGVDSRSLWAGTHEAQIFLFSDDPGDPEIAVPFRLEVQAEPHIELSPTTIQLTPAFVGWPSDFTITVENTGLETLTVWSVTSDLEELSIAGGAFVVAPHSSHQLNGAFLPQRTGAYSGVISFESDDPENGSLELAVTADAVRPPAFVVQPLDVEIRLVPGQRQQVLLEISNQGGYRVEWRATLEGVELPGSATPNPEHKAATTWATVWPGSGVVAPGATQSAPTVSFDASELVPGDYAGRLLLQSNDPERPSLEIPLLLQVRIYPVLAPSTDALDFGEAILGGEVLLGFEVENAGSDLLVVDEITSDRPEFSVENGSFALEIGASRTVAVRFTPTVDGPLEANLGIHSNDPDHPEVTLRLVGTGLLPPQLSYAPGSFAFTLIEGGSGEASVDIANVGASRLDWWLRTRWLGSGKLGDVGGKRVLFDLSLGQGPIEPWSESVAGLEAQGAQVVASDVPVSAETLSEFDLLWLNTTPLQYEAGQLAAIRSFVSQGGGVLLVGDSNLSLDAYAAILGELGLSIELSRVDGLGGVTTEIATHALTEGVQELWLETVRSTIAGVGGDAQMLVRDRAGAGVVAVGTLGRGRVAVLTDQIFDDAHSAQADNRRFGEQLMDWLLLRSDLTITPTSGGVEPFAEPAQPVIHYDSEGLATGIHRYELLLTTNIPLDPVRSIPFTLLVASQRVLAESVVLAPEVLFVGSETAPLLAQVELPTGYEPADLVEDSVWLQNHVAADPPYEIGDFNGNGRPDVGFHFDRAAVEAILVHEGQIEFRIEGLVGPQATFDARATLRVVLPYLNGPQPGAVFFAGEELVASWDWPNSTRFSSAGLAWSPDAGATWSPIASGLSPHGEQSFRWQLPLLDAEAPAARLRLTMFDAQGVAVAHDDGDAEFAIRAEHRPNEPSFAAAAPNPFRGATVFSFALTRDANARLIVYDLRGRLVAGLLDEARGVGSHRVPWDGRDHSGTRVASGVYFVRLDAGDFHATRRVTLAR